MRYLFIVSLVSLAVLVGFSPQQNRDYLKLQKKSSTIVKGDLNGEGKKDKISFKCSEDEFTLTINGASIKGSGDMLDGKYKIVDIDTKDKIQEISISESGSSDDYATAFYYYNGKKIVFMGKVQGSDSMNNDILGSIKINGKGTVIARTRGQILHTWFYDDPYKLTKSHTLARVPQDLYQMNAQVKVIKPLALQKSRTNSETAVTLQTGETVIILASDDKQWCLVQNSKGAKGWFAVEDFDKIKGTNLRASEVFEGLCYAD